MMITGAYPDSVLEVDIPVKYAAAGVGRIKKVGARYTGTRTAERGERYWASGLGMVAK